VKALLKDAEKVVNFHLISGIRLRGEKVGYETRPFLSESEIRFNGLAPEEYETFLLNFTMLGGLNGFCKTAHRPYDAVVCDVLLLSSVHIQGFQMRSDGFGRNQHDGTYHVYEGWIKAVKRVKELTGHDTLDFSDYQVYRYD